MANPVVITRPIAQAETFAQRVAALGRNAIVFPLLEIRPLADPAPLHAVLADLSGFAMVAFVSPNAIDATFDIVHSWPKDVALAVIGDGSKTALARYGVTSANADIVSPRDPARTDSETLLDALDLHALQGKRVLIVRGETGRELLADALRNAGIEVIQVAAYRRNAPTLEQAQRKQLTELANSENDWIITSSEALRNLIRMARQVLGDDGVAKMLQQKIIISHMRIEETARELGFRHITLTGSGDEQLLAALQFSQ
ncbi:MAG: uroporphyrinogen III synthase [Burkholderiales bacterium RIFCSPLOWO2_02_FULL_57_36]|nr:MAG: uroporphyrinogen III synthase [Burkholderiales bacterium RIFCSPLOWO2_02_FULL_57_36]